MFVCLCFFFFFWFGSMLMSSSNGKLVSSFTGSKDSEFWNWVISPRHHVIFVCVIGRILYHVTNIWRYMLRAGYVIANNDTRISSLNTMIARFQRLRTNMAYCLFVCVHWVISLKLCTRPSLSSWFPLTRSGRKKNDAGKVCCRTF